MTAYGGSSVRTVLSSRCRVQITSHVSSPKMGTMNAAYTAKNPYSPNADEPFHIACMPIASSSPERGKATRWMCRMVRRERGDAEADAREDGEERVRERRHDDPHEEGRRRDGGDAAVPGELVGAEGDAQVEDVLREREAGGRDAA